MIAENTEYLTAGAVLSPCRTWRYRLWRSLDNGGDPWPVFVGLNPSTADENEDDRTIRRCRGFSKRWGYGGFYMLNLFALRATDPRELKVHEDPVGPENMDYIHDMCRSCQTSGSLIVACWGNHGE